ncbi:MAG: rRNA maturation RNase YbeY [bacterium]|nr:rRNA maturation RNase YbeY [bacterium]MDO5461873.1 rRNA maturation RNase YbeY [bacterium]
MLTEIRLKLHGRLTAPLTKIRLLKAATYCITAAQRWSRPKTPWQEVTIHLIHDSISASVNKAIMNHDGPTDVITQRYEPFPGEPEGLIGELYVNLDEALRISQQLKRTTFEEETILYIAHGCDHLTDADDATPPERAAMRKRDLRWMHAATRLLNK